MATERDRLSDLPAEFTPEAVDAAPLIFADGAIGLAEMADVIRITLGAATYNPVRSADEPRLRPVAHLVIARPMLEDMIASLQQFLDRSNSKNDDQ